MRKVIDKKGQVWVETVIYTLIGLAIIGLVLAAALPKIQEKKDEIVIDQSIEALLSIDSKIYEAQRAPGNVRTVDLSVKKGSLIFDNEDDTISWELTSSFPYSQEGVDVPIGGLSVLTEKGNPWKVTLKLSYAMDLQYNDQVSGTKQLEPAPTPYKLMIENAGKNTFSGNIIIAFSDN